MAEITGKSAKIKYTAVTGTASTGNAATRSTGAGSETGYVQIDAVARRHWDRATTPTLYLNSTVVPSSNYDVNYVQGKFQWRTGDPSTGTYTIDTTWLAASYLTGGRSWSLDVNVDMHDVTTFSTSTADVTWRTFVPGLSDATMSISRLVSTGDTGPVFYDRLNLPGDVIVEAVTNDLRRLEAFGFVDGDSWEIDPESLTAESVSIQLDGEVYYSTS